MPRSTRYMAIQLYDSLTRTLKPLAASQLDGVFRFYNCGPTVYAPAHIGNFRTFIVNDILRRLLELELGADKVHHVRNLTDVDDRTIQQTRKEGRPLAEITAHWTAKFHADCDALGCLPPHVEPTATGHIREQVDMIECLMERGNAYRAADGSVYFRINSFPDYGALSRIKDRELKITNEAADSDHKDSVSDFALWKAYKPEEDGDVQWPGPRGAAAGRPGWHIECSAMIKKHLGETIDLHTGGVDLLFPHHENEIAQSQCCNGGTTFARHWYHSEHLLVDGTTMSKSKGNYYTLSDLTAKGYSPMAVRYALLSGHPRKQLNFTLDSLHAAERALKTLRNFRAKLAAKPASDLPSRTAETSPSSTRASEPAPTKGVEALFNALHDDLNTPAALGALFTLVNRGADATDAPSLADFDRVLFALGLDLSEAKNVDQAAPEIPAEVTALAEQRWAAKLAKDWGSADALRAQIAALGWAMRDRKDGYSLEPQN
ncbi:cysteine--tRNA ligase [Cephaloticoccus capnophilus]|nr:cysteine--tRNA ligase [Cephaloticoccus capnophilus]